MPAAETVNGAAEAPSLADSAPQEANPAPSWQALSARRYGYRVGALGFLVGANTHSEVVRTPVVSSIPHSPEWLLGVMNLRGNLVPVADLHRLCGEPSDGRTATVLVLGTGELAIAIPTDDLPRALSGLQPLAAMPPLPSGVAAHAGTAFGNDDGVWVAFEHEEFFRALARGAGAHS